MFNFEDPFTQAETISEDDRRYNQALTYIINFSQLVHQGMEHRGKGTRREIGQKTIGAYPVNERMQFDAREENVEKNQALHARIVSSPELSLEGVNFNLNLTGEVEMPNNDGNTSIMSFVPAYDDKEEKIFDLATQTFYEDGSLSDMRMTIWAGNTLPEFLMKLMDKAHGSR